MYPGVHNPEPEWRNGGQQHHARITSGELRVFIMILKYLVFTVRKGVVVTMAAQLKQHKPAYNVIGVPGMCRLGVFIAVLGNLFSP